MHNLKRFVKVVETGLLSAVIFAASDGATASAEEEQPPSKSAAACTSEELQRIEDSGDDDVEDSGIADNPAPKDASEVLCGTIARFPVEPISMSGELILRKQRGVVVREIQFSMALNWGSDPATATYDIFDGFGRVMQTLKVERTHSGSVSMTLSDASGKIAPAPMLTDSVNGTDITWLDMTLAFMWWKDARLDGTEDFRGALCDIVVVTPPEPIPGCASMRLWMDRKRGFLRQAEQLDENGRWVRKMWVASVGKISGRWMIRNMEVERPGTGLRTKLHVDTLETL